MEKFKPLIPSQDELTRLAAEFDWNSLGETEHLALFYETEHHLVESVAHFLLAGFAAGEGAIVIATKAHRRGIEEALSELGVNLLDLQLRGCYSPLDAAETLAHVSLDGEPDAGRFRHVIGGSVRAAAKGRTGLRAFGDMAGLLWSAGKAGSALRLEGFWNDLAKSDPFKLLCAYPIDAFRDDEDQALFSQLCRLHSRVIPAESYLDQPGPAERLRCISVLQQKAACLDGAVAERKRAEAMAQERLERLEFVLAAGEMGLWEYDLDSGAFTASEACRKHCGFSPDGEISYAEFFDRVHPEDRQRLKDAFLNAATEDRGGFRIRHRMGNGSGEVRWVYTTGRCFDRGEHRLVGLTAGEEKPRPAPFAAAAGEGKPRPPQFAAAAG